jgi:preprotein translocase subunit SecE
MANAAPARKKGGMLQFAREVRSEARKITWTSRRETIIATIMVFIMVVFAAIFFFVVDLILRQGIGFLLNLGGSPQ